MRGDSGISKRVGLPVSNTVVATPHLSFEVSSATPMIQFDLQAHNEVLKLTPRSMTFGMLLRLLQCLDTNQPHIIPKTAAHN